MSLALDWENFTLLDWGLIFFGIYNIIVFVVYGFDKMSANAGVWRISEKVLLLMALFFGSPGAILGMYIFRHKTRKMSFQLWLYLILLIQAGIGYLIYRFYFNS